MASNIWELKGIYLLPNQASASQCFVIIVYEIQEGRR